MTNFTGFSMVRQVTMPSSGELRQHSLAAHREEVNP